MTNRLYIGLGNPGKRYELNRHNIGFMVLIALAQKCGITFKESSRFPGNSGKGSINGTTIHLLMPLTYMNDSGTAARKYMDYYQIPISDLVVITDDVALPYGKVRIRQQGSSGGHNGLKSIQKHLSTQNYVRVRMGVGSPPSPQSLESYVLSNFSATEIKNLPDLIGKGLQTLEMLATKEISEVMSLINRNEEPRQQNQQENTNESQQAKSL